MANPVPPPYYPGNSASGPAPKENFGPATPDNITANIQAQLAASGLNAGANSPGSGSDPSSAGKPASPLGSLLTGSQGSQAGADPLTAAGGTPSTADASTANAGAGGAAGSGTAGSTGGSSTVTVDLAPDTKKIAQSQADSTASLGGGLSEISTFLQALEWFLLPTSWVRILCFLGAVPILFFGLHYLGKEIKS